MALLTEFIGGRPTVPAFNAVNVQQQQQQAISGNAASLPALQAQANQINTFNQDELQRMLERALPGYGKLRDKTTANISDWLAGKVPQDVSDQVMRSAAGRSLYGGFGGSGMARNLTGRDLGLTSLDIMGKGMDAASKWLASARAGISQFDVSSMFIRPEFQAQFAAQERNAAFQRDYIENQWQFYDSWGQKAVRFENSVIQLAGDIAGMAGACWVARTALGTSDDRWKEFRAWLFTSAPAKLLHSYLKYGQSFAAYIESRSALKALVRLLLVSILRISRTRKSLFRDHALAGLSDFFCWLLVHMESPSDSCLDNNLHRCQSGLATFLLGVPPYPHGNYRMPPTFDRHEFHAHHNSTTLWPAEIGTDASLISKSGTSSSDVIHVCNYVSYIRSVTMLPDKDQGLYELV